MGKLVLCAVFALTLTACATHSPNNDPLAEYENQQKQEGREFVRKVSVWINDKHPTARIESGKVWVENHTDVYTSYWVGYQSKEGAEVFFSRPLYSEGKSLPVGWKDVDGLELAATTGTAVYAPKCRVKDCLKALAQRGFLDNVNK